jgi:hypothetical protein
MVYYYFFLKKKKKIVGVGFELNRSLRNNISLKEKKNEEVR